MTNQEILDAALLAAAEATNKMIKDNPDQWYPCGFSWVVIKPARGAFVKLLKEQHIGETTKYYGGHSIWNPSNNPTQWMDAKYAGSLAFARVLTENGINCNVRSRMD